MIEKLTNDKLFDSPIVTEVVPASTFYIAESYHQEYFVQNPSQPYCSYLIGPKIAKFRQQFAGKAEVLNWHVPSPSSLYHRPGTTFVSVSRNPPQMSAFKVA